MARIFSANSSSVLVDNENVEGLRSIEYKLQRERNDVFAVGSDERIGVYYGARRVVGRLVVASANAKLDGLAGAGTAFQVVANLRHGDASRSVAFDDCYLEGKEFSMASGGHGEMVYTFSATRVREEDAAAAGAGAGG
jgi:hypothetical protein